ncbi:hypothetical protein [Sphingomonas sp.]
MAAYLRDDTSGRRWEAVTANRTFSVAPRAIYAGGAGTVLLTGDNGVERSFKFAEGEIKALSPASIKMGTATDVVAIY